MISWKAPEYEVTERGPIWKIIMGISIFGLIAWGIWRGDWIMPLVIFAIALAYYSIHRHENRILEISLTDKGVRIGKKLYPYNRIKAFWILYEPPYLKKMMIRVSGELLYDIPVLLEDQDPEAIRNHMLQHVTELKDQRESLVDALARLLKI